MPCRDHWRSGKPHRPPLAKGIWYPQQGGDVIISDRNISFYHQPGYGIRGRAATHDFIEGFLCALAVFRLRAGGNDGGAEQGVRNEH